jgi:hypothetical protein
VIVNRPDDDANRAEFLGPGQALLFQRAPRGSVVRTHLRDDVGERETFVLRLLSLEPVMNFEGEKSVQSKYIPALRLGCRHDEQIIRVMSAMRNGPSALPI